MEYLILLIYKLIMNVLSCVLLPVFCLLLPPLASTAPEASFFSSAAPHMQNQRKSSCWWVVSLLLTSRGKYIYQRSGASYAGKYAFAILWTGCLERDQDDFILYHECSELLEWKALEKKRSPGGIETLVSSKHFGKPRFKLNYILTKGDYVHFDFQVNGIEVPRHRSKEKAVVHFPASNKDAVSSGDIDYDLHVYTGRGNTGNGRETEKKARICFKRTTWRRKSPSSSIGKRKENELCEESGRYQGFRKK